MTEVERHQYDVVVPGLWMTLRRERERLARVHDCDEERHLARLRLLEREAQLRHYRADRAAVASGERFSLLPESKRASDVAQLDIQIAALPHAKGSVSRATCSVFRSLGGLTSWPDEPSDVPVCSRNNRSARSMKSFGRSMRGPPTGTSAGRRPPPE